MPRSHRTIRWGSPSRRRPARPWDRRARSRRRRRRRPARSPRRRHRRGRRRRRPPRPYPQRFLRETRNQRDPRQRRATRGGRGTTSKPPHQQAPRHPATATISTDSTRPLPDPGSAGGRRSVRGLVAWRRCDAPPHSSCSPPATRRRWNPRVDPQAAHRPRALRRHRRARPHAGHDARLPDAAARLHPGLPPHRQLRPAPGPGRGQRLLAFHRPPPRRQERPTRSRRSRAPRRELRRPTPLRRPACQRSWSDARHVDLGPARRPDVPHRGLPRPKLGSDRRRVHPRLAEAHRPPHRRRRALARPASKASATSRPASTRPTARVARTIPTAPASPTASATSSPACSTTGASAGR